MRAGPSSDYECSGSIGVYEYLISVEPQASLLPPGEGARLRRQDAEANGEAGPEGVPQERHVKADEGEVLRSTPAASVQVGLPHPTLRATFSRREKGSQLSFDANQAWVCNEGQGKKIGLPGAANRRG
jgi:hypothetical protein